MVWEVKEKRLGKEWRGSGEVDREMRAEDIGNDSKREDEGERREGEERVGEERDIESNAKQS